ncbi:MAG: DNA repair protein RecO [Deltaproteobacteria bacterium]|nr:DNA repair protein RecO [Candidatus Zymogenaceae bacterium]
MRSHESHAVVLGTRDMGESDLLVELLSRDTGRIVGVAKAAKKSKRRFVNTFDLGHLIRVKYYLPRGRELFLIEDASLINPHGRLAGDLPSMAYTALVIELVRELFPETERSTDLFETTALILSILNERGARQDLLWLFVLRILKISGIVPLFSACVRCRSRQADAADRFFVPDAGGVVCGPCITPRDRTIELSCGTVTALSAATDIPIERLARIALTPASLSQTRDCLLSFIDHQLGKRMRSVDFIERYIS